MMGNSVAVVAESGSGKTHLAKIVAKKTGGLYCNYTGSVKATLKLIAEEIGCPTTVPTAKAEKAMSTDELKEEIRANLKGHILVIDNIQRWPASLKYWLEGIAEDNIPLLLLGTKRDLEGLSFKMPKMTLPALTDSEIRSIIHGKLTEIGLAMPSWRVAEIAAAAGGNPMLAYRLIEETEAGITSTLDASIYIDISPMMMAELMIIAAIRFLGMAMEEKSLYIIGGLGLTAFVMMKYLLRMLPKENKRR